MAKEVYGFVWAARKGERTFYPAIRTGSKVARYKSSGEGAWCGPKMSSTFFEQKWENADRAFLEAKISLIEELDRLMPQRPGWYGSNLYDCKMCGSVVHDRNRHLIWHKQAGIMVETLGSLFDIGSD